MPRRLAAERCIGVRRRLGLALLLLVTCFPAKEGRAGETETVDERVRQVLSAWQERDGDSFAKLALACAADGWLVADALLALGERRCAVAFAERCEDAEGRFLAAYVQRPEASEPQAILRQALRRGAGAGPSQAASDAERRAMDRLRPRYGTVLAVLHARRRADLAMLSGAVPSAVVAYVAASFAAERIGWRRRAAEELNFAAGIALEYLRRPGYADELSRDAQRHASDAHALLELADAHLGSGCARGELGDLGASAEACKEAALTYRRTRHPALEAMAWSNAGVAYHRLGRYTAALLALDEARAAGQYAQRAGRPTLEDVWALIWRAGVRRELQDLERAEADLDEVLRELQRRQAEHASREVARAAAYTHAQRVEVLRAAGELDKAAEASEAALRTLELLGDRVGYAQALSNDALVARERGDMTGALEKLREAWMRLVAAQDPVFALAVESELAETLRAAGFVDASETLHLDVLVQATAFGSADLVSRQWGALASCRRRRGDLAGAVFAGRRLAGEIGGVVGGLGDEESSLARDRFATALHDGAWAAARLGDVGSAVHLLEAGRAGALLEALGGRSRLDALVLPAAIHAELRDAKDTEARARAAFLEGAGSAAEVRRAQAEFAAVVSRMQRDAKDRVGLTYPSVDGLATLSSHLAEGDVLVLYALPEFGSRDTAFAVRIDRERGTLVDLGPAHRVRDVARRLIAASSHPMDRDSSDGGTARLLDEARATLTEKLQLGGDVRRVLISPDDELAYVPFARLLAEGPLSRAADPITGPDVHLIPSGTVLGEIRRQHEAVRSLARIEEVFAMADPDYGVGPGGVARDRLPQDQQYRPLPGTRAEALAVTPRPLLGKHATEANFRLHMADVPADQRLRAILLAAHGAIRESSPLRSAVALTPEGEDDGELTALEIAQMSVRADLVVLSACRSGLGGHARGEGVLGLVRAFMFAGVPRVMASTWKVDDDATRVLMTHFFERLKAGDRPAQALREAQEKVRATSETWNDPYYWAAWVLWGLPD